MGCEVGGQSGWEAGGRRGVGRCHGRHCGRTLLGDAGTAAQEAARCGATSSSRQFGTTACWLLVPCALAYAQRCIARTPPDQWSPGPAGVVVTLGCVPVG